MGQFSGFTAYCFGLMARVFNGWTPSSHRSHYGYFVAPAYSCFQFFQIVSQKSPLCAARDQTEDKAGISWLCILQHSATGEQKTCNRNMAQTRKVHQYSFLSPLPLNEWDFKMFWYYERRRVVSTSRSCPLWGVLLPVVMSPACVVLFHC